MKVQKKVPSKKGLFEDVELIQSAPVMQTFDFHRLVLPTSDGVALVLCKNILRCESDRASCIFHLTDGTAMRISKSLKFYEPKLREWNFIKVHKSNMVNLRHVDKYDKSTNGGSLILSDNSAVAISIRKKPRIKKVLQVS